MNQYVLLYPYCDWSDDCNTNDIVCLVEKLKPAWQAGKLNLPGGSIEPGETIHEAAVRELEEECDLICEVEDVELCGTLMCPNAIVYVLRCVIPSDDWIPLAGDEFFEEDTGQRCVWLPIKSALRDPHLIPNLRYIIPFLRCGITGWIINTDGQGNIEIKDDNENAEVPLPFIPVAMGER